MAFTAKDRAEVERKVANNIPLAGDEKGNIDPSALAYWQQLMTAKAASQTALNGSTTGNASTSSNQSSASGTVTYPGNQIVPSVTESAVTGYGFTAIVGLGLAFVVLALSRAFSSVRR